MRTLARALPCLFAPCLFALRCEPDGAGEPSPREARSPQDGLRRLWTEDIPDTLGGIAHATRILQRGDSLILANSSAGVMSWRLARDSEPRVESSTEALRIGGVWTPETEVPRCTTAAWSDDGRRLYCGALDGDAWVFSLDDPNRPRPLREFSLRAPDAPDAPGARDMMVRDGALWIASPTRGLFRVPLDDEGLPAGGASLALAGDLVAVAADASRAAVLDRARGVAALSLEGSTARPSEFLPLDGAALGLRVRGETALVALGSAGVAVVDLSGSAPRLRARVETRCVATSADLYAQTLAVACLSGTALYDLRGAAPRLAGCDPAHFGALDVRFTEDGRLLGIDWRRLTVYTPRIDGACVRPAVGGGSVIRQGNSAEVVAHNQGANPMRMRLALDPAQPGDPGSERWSLEAEVAAGGTQRWVLSAAQLDALGAGRFGSFQFRVENADDRMGDTASRVRIIVRDERAAGPPAQGDRLTPWSLRDGRDGPPVLPPEEPTDVVFFLPDCALQWPAIEDYAWAWRAGRLPRRPLVISVSSVEGRGEPEGAALLDRFGATALGGHLLGSYFESGAGGSIAVYESRFGARVLGGADVTEVLRLDAGRALRSIERVYRGAWPLR